MVVVLGIRMVLIVQSLYPNVNSRIAEFMHPIFLGFLDCSLLVVDLHELLQVETETQIKDLGDAVLQVCY